MFSAAWGDEARFTSKERAMIQPPLGRILSRMTPEDGAKFTAFADPVFLGAGLLIWGVRVWTLQQRAVRPTPQTGRPSGPVVQGIPENEMRTEHAPASPTGNGSANVNPQIASEWGNI